MPKAVDKFNLNQYNTFNRLGIKTKRIERVGITVLANISLRNWRRYS